jgi:hypothetical protein
MTTEAVAKRPVELAPGRAGAVKSSAKGHRPRSQRHAGNAARMQGIAPSNRKVHGREQ